MNRVRWENERPGVFAGHLDGRIVGRVVGELKAWDWAYYRDAWTGDSGKTTSFADACEAVEALAQEVKGDDWGDGFGPGVGKEIIG